MTEDETDSITDSMDINLSKLWETMRTEKTDMLQSMGSQRVRQGLATTTKWQGCVCVCVCVCVCDYTTWTTGEEHGSAVGKERHKTGSAGKKVI